MGLAGTLDRTPPTDLEAEKALLSCLLMADVDVTYDPGDFSRAAHTNIAQAVLELRTMNQAVDAISVAHHMETKGTLEPSGGRMYLLDVNGYAPTTANAKQYAKVVAELARRRRIIAACVEAEAAAYDGEGYEEAAERVPQVSSASSVAVSLGQTLVECRSTLGEAREYVWLKDYQGMHLHSGDMVIIGARPKVGKSALGAQIGQELAARHLPVRIYSLEMKRHDFAYRYLQRNTPFTTNDFDQGLDAPRLGLVDAAIKDLKDLPITFRDDPSMTVAQCVSDMKRFARSGGRVAIIDYLQLLIKPKGKKSRYELATEASNSLKVAALETGLVVIALSQLNRGVADQKTGKLRRPGLADLRETGALEQDADVVILLHTYEKEEVTVREKLREAGYILEGDEASSGTKKLSLIDFAAMRRGMTRSYPSFFDGQDQAFLPIDRATKRF